MKSLKKTLLTLIAAASVIYLAAFIKAPAVELAFTLRFVDHLETGMIEQDVFVRKNRSSESLYWVLPEEMDIYLDPPIYSTGNSQHHNPLNKGNLGPFPNGKALDMTLRKGLESRGEVSYRCEDGWGTLNASFENLLPGATRTSLWRCRPPMRLRIPRPSSLANWFRLRFPVGCR